MSKVILRKILSNSETPVPKVLLLTDSIDVSGRGVLYCLLKSHLGVGNDVHYLTTTNSPQAIRKFLSDEGFSGKIKYYDGFSDPCGWEDKDSCVQLSDNLHQIFRESNAEPSKKNIYVIDKIESVLDHQESLTLIRDLHKFSSDDKVEQLVVYCGRDCIPENVLKSLSHFSSAIIHLQKGNPTQCRVVVRKPSGKLIKTHEEFTLSPDLKILENREVKTKSAPPVETSDTDAVLAAQTTFNLSLTEDQRKSKNNLLLPHTRVQSSGGQIHYTPDDEDDWDEEDPDDDLNI